MATKQVAWQPISKRKGTPRPYWLHRAVSLRFHRVTSSQWCLSIRPEFHVTTDGYTPEFSKRIGSRVTRKKSRMFNYDLLGEVNFWRDYLSDSEPRIILDFGMGSSLIISTSMMQTEIEWPGIPDEYAKPFKNIEYADDLFTWAKLQEVSSDTDLEDEWDDEEDWALEEDDEQD